MKAWLRSLLAHGWGRAAVVAMGLGGLLVLSGALALIFYRPYGHDVRAQLGSGHLGLRVALASALQLVHLVAAVAFTAAVVGLVVLCRPWKRERGAPGPGRARLALIALIAATFVGTGIMVPWERLLPWSPAVGSNMARPMPLGQPGPFAELIGVNTRYDDAMFTVARRRLGARATGRVYLAHVLWLPLVSVVAGVMIWRRRRP